MISTVAPWLRCPLCRGPLEPTGPERSGREAGSALRCPDGHSFDVARQGYANLLTGRAPAGAETAEMVAARADLFDSGAWDPILAAVADEATVDTPPEGLIVDVGAGTGHYLAAVLDRWPDHHGVALDVSKAAVRRAARAHPRAAALVCDIWRGLPLADGCAAVVLDVFAPRNGAEFRRVLGPTGRVIVVTPGPEHLAELIGPLGLIGIDPTKDARLDRSLGGHLELLAERHGAYALNLTREQAALAVRMGPNAWHADPVALERRLAEWPPTVTVTASIVVRTYGAGP